MGRKGITIEIPVWERLRTLCFLWDNTFSEAIDRLLDELEKKEGRTIGEMLREKGKKIDGN